jgi:hypothetical protein
MTLDETLNAQVDGWAMEGQARVSIPDGNYQAKITEVKFRQTKEKKTWQLNFTLEIAAGKFVTKKVWINLPLEGSYIDKNGQKQLLIGITNLALKNIGFDLLSPIKIKELVASEKLIGTLVEIELTTKGKNQNGYMKKRIDIAEEEIEEFDDIEDEIEDPMELGEEVIDEELEKAIEESAPWLEEEPEKTK